MNRWIKLFNQSFASNNQSSKVARDRLSEMIQSQRNTEFFSNINMIELRNELTNVLGKYIKITRNEPAQFLGILNIPILMPMNIHKNIHSNIFILVKQDGALEILEMQIPIETSNKTGRSI